MPDLGEYATDGLAAYGGSIALIGILIWMSWRRYAQVRSALEKVENNG